MKNRGKWTDEEMTFLKENYGKLKMTKIAEMLGRSYNGVFQKMRVLGLNKLDESEETDNLV